MPGRPPVARAAVSLAVTHDLEGLTFKARGARVRRALEEAVEHLREEMPDLDLEVDWGTISTSGQLVVAHAPADAVPRISATGQRHGILIDALVIRDVAQST